MGFCVCCVFVCVCAMLKIQGLRLIFCGLCCSGVFFVFACLCEALKKSSVNGVYLWFDCVCAILRIPVLVFCVSLVDCVLRDCVCLCDFECAKIV